MPKRQIVLFALTGLVVLYAAYTYLWAPLVKDPGKAITLNRVELQTAIDDIRSQITQTAPNALEAYRLGLAVEDMGANPFHAYQGPSETGPQEAGQAKEGPSFTYSGFVEMSGTRVAIINGLDYMEGEELAQAGYYLAHIERNKVVIEKRNEDHKVLERIAAPLSDDFAIVSEEKDEDVPADH